MSVRCARLRATQEARVLKIYGRRNSANVQKVMWLVAELGLAHEHVPLGGAFGGVDTPEHRARNPQGKVPAIDDDGLAVWESHAILRYLAAKYGGEQFWPQSPATRARVEPWMDWSQCSWQPDFLGGVFWGYYRTPAPQRDHAAIRSAIARCTADLQLLEAALAKQPFIAGKALSLADIPAGSLLFRYFTMEVELPEQRAAWRPALPNVEAWYRRLCDRAAYREHVMVPYADMLGRLAF
jgi:glutathione S-transferase